MRGQSVCRIHGGKSPQALAKAEERMRALVAPALASLRRQIDNGEFPATKYVLDWAGFKAVERAEMNAQTLQVTVLFDRTDDLDLEQIALPGG